MCFLFFISISECEIIYIFSIYVALYDERSIAFKRFEPVETVEAVEPVEAVRVVQVVWPRIVGRNTFFIPVSISFLFYPRH